MHSKITKNIRSNFYNISIFWNKLDFQLTTKLMWVITNVEKFDKSQFCVNDPRDRKECTKWEILTQSNFISALIMCLAGKICVSYNVPFATVTVATYIFIPFPTDLFLWDSDESSLLQNESSTRICTKNYSCLIFRNSIFYQFKKTVCGVLQFFLINWRSYSIGVENSSWRFQA